MAIVPFSFLQAMTGVGNAGKAKSRHGPAVLLNQAGLNKADFKQMMQDLQAGGPLPQKLLTKLKRLCQLSPAELADQLARTDSEILLELEGLLKLPFKKLIEQMKANWPEELGGESDPRLAESLLRIRALIEKQVAVSDLKGSSVEVPVAALSSAPAEPKGSDLAAQNSKQQLKKPIGDQGNQLQADRLAVKVADQSALNQDTKAVLAIDQRQQAELAGQQGQTEGVKANQQQAEQLTVKIKGSALAAKDAIDHRPAWLFPLAKKTSSNPGQQINPAFTVRPGEPGNAGPAKSSMIASAVRLISDQLTGQQAMQGLRASQPPQAGDRLAVLKASQHQQSSQGDSLSSLIGQATNQGSELSEAANARTVIPTNNLSAVIEQITARLQVIQAGRNQIDIQLEPAELGRVRVQLKLEAGELVAKLLVENQGVKGYLEQNLSVLRTDLVRQGFSVEQIQVEYNDFNPKEDYNSEQEYRQEEQSGHQAEQEEYPELAFAELASLLEEGELAELPEGLLEGYRWLNQNYYRNRMNFLA